MEKRLRDASDAGVQQVTKCKDDALLKIGGSRNAFDEVLKQVKRDWEAFDKRYKWLLSNEQAAKDTFLKEVATVYDVHQAVETMWNSYDKPDNIADLTQNMWEK